MNQVKKTFKEKHRTNRAIETDVDDDIMSSPLQMYAWIFIALTGLVFQYGSAIRCSLCDTTSTSSCLARPPPAQDCSNGFDYCIAVAKYAMDGQLVSFARSCSPLLLADSCVNGMDKATLEARQICYKTCAKDGCNGFTYMHHILDFLRRR